MSRLFEALQRSESERTGVPFSWPHLTSQPTLVVAEPEDALNQCQAVTVTPAEDSKLVGLTEKDGLGAEKFRFLAVRLRQLRQTRNIRKVLITSSMAEEGKSLISANLAIAFAHRHVQKILLIEGDLRRPTLLQQFGLPEMPGICEQLQSGGPALSNVLHLANCGFWLLPAGRAPENPIELMQSEHLSTLMDELASVFDWIVIDSPPILPLADTSVWARVADGMLLVVNEGNTKADQLKASMDALNPKNLLGVVLNNCTAVDRSNYYQRYYSPPSKT